MPVMANRLPKNSYKISLGNKPHELSKGIKNRNSHNITLIHEKKTNHNLSVI
jgi:hypothetical protein